LDGCSEFGIFWRIILPNCPPSALMRQIGWVEEGRISGSS
jgi:ABC-type sugar transport system permease subunit